VTTQTSVVTGARVVTAAGVLEDAWVDIRGSRIFDVGMGRPPEAATDLGGAWIVPGFIDVHVHGGGGYDFTTSPAEMAAGVEYHRSRGTTRTLISLVTAPVAALCQQLGWVADLATAGTGVIGAHLEGPFLAHARCGAQNSDYMLTPDREILARLIEAGRGYLRTMTFAPELPGSFDVISMLIAAGVVPAVGHTDADYEQAAQAFAEGASLVTHLFNAMRPLTHREPGPIIAAMEAGVMFELINDGFHVHDGVTRQVARGHADQLILVTDAISATGAGDGNYVLGERAVIVNDGQPRLASTGRLAGSTLTMDEAFRRAVLDIGLPVEHAVAAASTNPARLLGLDGQCGSITAGMDADLVVLDDKFELVRVMSCGEWI
jgi:N-acetylglucosamine-6-phosphate deacetylase